MDIPVVNTFLELHPGKAIATKMEISHTKIYYWTYGKEFPFNGAALAQGTRLKVVEVNKTPGNRWVKLLIPYSDPPKYLKVTAEEYVLNFEPL